MHYIEIKQEVITKVEVAEDRVARQYGLIKSTVRYILSKKFRLVWIELKR